MINPKIEKVKTEIKKTKTKISELQIKLRELEREKVRLEDEQIVALIRSERISDSELSALMESFRKPGTAKKEALQNEGDETNVVLTDVTALEKTRLEESLNANFDEE